MKTRYFCISALAVFLLGNLPLLSQTAYIDNRLSLTWEASGGTLTPESVIYDAVNNCIYVSNINDKPSEKDGNGFLSRLSVDGKILDAQWVTGLSAPKGMGIWKDKLYVSDIDEVIEISLPSGKILQRYFLAGSKFLNDISIDPQGRVYISDMRNQKIYRMEQGNAEVWIQDEKLENVNGLLAEGDYILAGTKNSIYKIVLSTGEISEFITNTGGIDGIVQDGRGNYLFSDWSGHVYMASPGKEKVKLLDTTPIETNAADIWYIQGKDLLLVPTFFKNSVAAYRFKP